MSQINISVIGTSATRGCFELMKLENLEQICNVSIDQYQSSMISIMSEPLGKNVTISDKIKGWDKQVINMDFKKELFKNLEIQKPHYIVVDFIADILYGVLNIGRTSVTNNKNKLSFVQFHEDVEVFTIHTHKDEYLTRWYAATQQFLTKVKEILPNTKVIIHSARFVNSYYDENNFLKSFQRNDLQSKNRYLEQMEEMIVNEDVTFINLSKSKYHSSSNHKWKKNIVNYETRYYHDFLLEFLCFIIKEQNNLT